MDIKDTILQALRNYRGDDLVRVRNAFRGMTPLQMAHPHGESGMTRQEVLDTYVRHEADVDAAMEWVRTK